MTPGRQGPSYFPAMGQLRWTPERMAQLEHAVQHQRRIAVRRRGNDFVVIARRLTQVRGREALIAIVPMTGEEMVFQLDQLDQCQILSS